MQVACVLKSGGDFRPEHVARLRDQVKRYLPGAEFVCLSDVDVPCERIPLQTKLTGWWAKLELFCLRGPVMYFDLDTTIVGPLGEIAAYQHRFTAPIDWYKNDRLCSAFMAWNGDYEYLLTEFRKADHSKYSRDVDRWGYQGYIQDHLRVRPECVKTLFPGSFVSYKKHCREGIPEGARVVCFHGKPRPWEVEHAKAA